MTDKITSVIEPLQNRIEELNSLIREQRNHAMVLGGAAIALLFEAVRRSPITKLVKAINPADSSNTASSGSKILDGELIACFKPVETGAPAPNVAGATPNSAAAAQSAPAAPQADHCFSVDKIQFKPNAKMPSTANVREFSVLDGIEIFLFGILSLLFLAMFILIVSLYVMPTKTTQSIAVTAEEALNSSGGVIPQDAYAETLIEQTKMLDDNWQLRRHQQYQIAFLLVGAIILFLAMTIVHDFAAPLR